MCRRKRGGRGTLKFRVIKSPLGMEAKGGEQAGPTEANMMVDAFSRPIRSYRPRKSTRSCVWEEVGHLHLDISQGGAASVLARLCC